MSESSNKKIQEPPEIAILPVSCQGLVSIWATSSSCSSAEMKDSSKAAPGGKFSLPLSLSPLLSHSFFPLSSPLFSLCFNLFILLLVALNCLQGNLREQGRAREIQEEGETGQRKPARILRLSSFCSGCRKKLRVTLKKHHFSLFLGFFEQVVSGFLCFEILPFSNVSTRKTPTWGRQLAQGDQRAVCFFRYKIHLHQLSNWVLVFGPIVVCRKSAPKINESCTRVISGVNIISFLFSLFYLCSFNVFHVFSISQLTNCFLSFVAEG